MKRTVTKLISILLVTVMCFSMLPVEVFAWGKMTHVYTANLIEDDLLTTGAGSTTVKNYNYAVPEEFLEAIEAYPDAFRAGALGPDMYPDILTGQMYIHPEDENIDSGEWVTYLCNAVNKMGKDTEGRKVALAFTLGCMLHYCGDLFGHDFVNTFSGGAFPSVANVEMLDIKSERLNNVMSHMSIETYMDSKIYSAYSSGLYGGIDAPDQFIRDAMIFNGTPAAGLVPLYNYYPALELQEIDTGDIFIISDVLEDILDDLFDNGTNNVPPHYTAFLALRNYVTSVADEHREIMEVVCAAITRYCDEWAADIDRGINAFTETCDNIARRLITKDKNPVIEAKKKEEREKEKNDFLDLSGFNYESMIMDYYAEEEVDEVRKALEDAEIYGDSFFDLILMELILQGVITVDMVKTNDGSISIIKEELSFWMDEYGVYMLGIPDILIDGIEIPVIGDIIDLLIMKPLWSWIGGEIKNLAAEWIVSACTGAITGITGWEAEDVAQKTSDLISQMDDRLENPQLQLDHPDNPYKPSENNFEELAAYLNTLSAERRAMNMDSEFEALYNTLVMFQLVLMGPENYSKFISTNAYGAKQTAYQKNTGHLETASLKFRIRTSDLWLSGTDDNIYVRVYRKNPDGTKTEFTCKLLDKSGYNDFEAGDDDEYLVELPKSVKLDELEIALRKTPMFDFLPSLTDDWHCANIQVTPQYAGYDLCEPVDLGGIHLKGICQNVNMVFSDALAVKGNKDPASLRATNLRVRVKVKDEMWSGSDSDIYIVAYYDGIQWAKVCLDKAWNNDLERNETEIYDIPITYYANNVRGIPLNELDIKIKHEGIDGAKWESIVVVPYFGDLPLIEGAIEKRDMNFEDCTLDLNAQSFLKNATYPEYEPIEIEYETSLDDGLLSYMGSLDGGEEWVDKDSELWQNTTLRRDIFLKLFKGFAPEIALGKHSSSLENNTVDLEIDFTGVWNGVSNERRSQVKDLEHVYPVEGTANLELIDESGKVVKVFNGVAVENNSLKYTLNTNGLKEGYYGLKISYSPDNANPLYAETAKTFEKAVRVASLQASITPENVTAETGQKVNLTVNASGGKAPYTYKWMVRHSSGKAWVILNDSSNYQDIAKYQGQGTNTLTCTIISAGSKEVICEVADANGMKVNAKAMIFAEKATIPLSITTQPKDTAVEAGQKAILTVEASGGKAPYTYTWQMPNGRTWKDIPISTAGGPNGQGTKSLIFSSGIISRTTSVRCVVKDAKGNTVTSDTATITVQETTAPLSITTQPKSITVEAGETATFTVAASGGKAPYTYTWQMPSGSNWIAVQNGSGNSGQGTDTFNFKTESPVNTRVRCVVKDASGNTVTSNEAAVTVKAPPLIITTQPKSVTVEAGETATFTVAASGGKAPYTYTWQMPSGSNWIAVQNGSGNSGQGTDTFNFKTESPVNTRIRCVVKDASGNTVTSDTATITVTATEPLSIKSQPQSITITEGHPAGFNVVVSGGKAPYTYTWQMLSGRNWKDIPEQIQVFGPQMLGQGKDTLLCLEMPEGVVKLRCVIKDANGKEVISDTATLTVNAKVTPLVITSQPMDTILETGGNSGVYVEVSGGKAPYTYTWQILIGNNWNTLRDSAQVFGQGTNALICAPTEADIVTVRCVIKDASGQEVISGAATITVKAAPLTAKIVQPTDVTVEAGETVRFTVEVSGGQAPYKYSWEGLVGKTWRGIRESAIHKGQGSNTLSCTPNDVGRTKCRCVVTDSAGNTVTTETISVTVKPLSVQINNGEKEITFYHTETETLTANVTGGTGPYTYTWYRYRYIWNTKSYEWEKVSEASSYKADGAPRESYRVKVEVKDSTGTTVTAEIYVRLTGIVN